MVWHFFSFWVLCDFQMSLDPWLGCEEYVECEWALELNGCQVLFECGHGRYWYLGNRVLAQVQLECPPTTILLPPCPSIRLADLLANEEIARARIGHVVSGTLGIYFDFIQTQLQGCLAGIFLTSVSLFPSEVKLHFILYAHFPYFHFVIVSVCCTLRLHLLKKRKRGKRILLLSMLTALLVLSWRPILTFLHGNMK